MKSEENHWTGMRESQISVKAGKGSVVHLGEGNQRDGDDFATSVESDKSSIIKRIPERKRR